MSANPPTTTPTPAPVSAPSPIITALADAAKLVVGFAASPGGLSLATTILGATNPAILLVEQFGVRILGPLLATWTGPTISETDVTNDLATKGMRVAVFDPMAAFGS